MKTFLVTIAVLSLIAMPLLTAEETKIDLSGRLAVGYENQGKGATNTSSFTVPDAKIQLTGKIAEDVSGVIRLDLNGGIANDPDYVYISVDNLINKMANTKSPVNPSIIVGKQKINFGEETYSNNAVENALVNPSIANISGNDIGITFKQEDLVPNLPLILGASLAFYNGNGVVDTNNSKAYGLKVSGTMKSMPLYFSFSSYTSNKLSTDDTAGTAAVTNTIWNDADQDGVIDAGEVTYLVVPAAPGAPGAPDAALNVMGVNDSAGGRNWTRKVYELDVRYDLLEGASKFDPSKAPLFSDSKGVFRLAYGQATDGEPVIGKITYAYVMLDGIYNVDKKWYVAFRYSYNDMAVDRAPVNDGKWTRISMGGGYRITDNTAMKLDYSQNTEPKPKVDNNSVNLIFCTKW
ncbi:MAG: porin [Planctomycetota bacterium]